MYINKMFGNVAGLIYCRILYKRFLDMPKFYQLKTYFLEVAWFSIYIGYRITYLESMIAMNLRCSAFSPHQTDPIKTGMCLAANGLKFFGCRIEQ
jgi:hypothetical protein